MSKRCQLTGKRTVRGYKYAIRGIAKKKKGIGLKTTGKTKRTFKPNIRKKRFWLPEEGRFITLLKGTIVNNMTVELAYEGKKISFTVLS